MMARVLPKKVVGFISRQIRLQRKEGKPIRQAVAIAFSKAKRKFPRSKSKLTRMM
jgi:hypothetical protein